MSVSQLRERYAEVFGEVTTTGNRTWLPRRIAWRIQPDVASRAMPAALLVIHGSKDGPFHPDGVKASFDKLAACYEKAGIPERLRTKLYETPHEFNAKIQAGAWEWLQ
jgi:hypothetical protein